MPSSDHFRAFARRPSSLPVLLRSDTGGGDVPAELIDLGLGGVCLALAESLPLGTSVRLRIDAPMLWEPLQLPGRIAWTNTTTDGRARLGVHFDVNSERTLAVLAELIGANEDL